MIDPAHADIRGLLVVSTSEGPRLLVHRAETYGEARAEVRVFAASSSMLPLSDVGQLPLPAGVHRVEMFSPGSERVEVVASVRPQGGSLHTLFELRGRDVAPRGDIVLGDLDRVVSAGTRLAIVGLDVEESTASDEDRIEVSVVWREASFPAARMTLPRVRGRDDWLVSDPLVAMNEERAAVAVIRCPSVGPHAFTRARVRCRLDLMIRDGRTTTHASPLEIFTGGEHVSGAGLAMALEPGGVVIAYPEGSGTSRARFVFKRFASSRWSDAAPALVQATDGREGGAVLALAAEPLRFVFTTSISGTGLEPPNPNSWQPRAHVATLEPSGWTVSSAFPTSRADRLGLTYRSGVIDESGAWVALASGAGTPGRETVCMGRFHDGQWQAAQSVMGSCED
ncbi:MAG: hypothetical protein M3Y87_33740 [Myxococcota bacterium]|nr:hypothetical protein [Myxococcota bacterium]